MRPLWRFIRNKNNREMIGWLGGGLVILATGAWALLEDGNQSCVKFT